MANSPQARKRARQNDKRRQENSAQKSASRKSVKALKKMLDHATPEMKEQIQESFRKTQSSLAKIATKGKIHKKTASRMIKRLNKATKEKCSA